MVSDCTLRETQLNDGENGGGGMRVSPLNLTRAEALTAPSKRASGGGFLGALARLSEGLTERVSGIAARLSHQMSGAAESVTTTVRRGSQAIPSLSIASRSSE